MYMERPLLFKLSAAGAGLLVLSGLFYWFQIWPMQVSRACDIEAVSVAINSGQMETFPLPAGSYKLRVRDAAFEYCLRKNGIKP
jgi:hypothetical protein